MKQVHSVSEVPYICSNWTTCLVFLPSTLLASLLPSDFLGSCSPRVLHSLLLLSGMLCLRPPLGSWDSSFRPSCFYSPLRDFPSTCRSCHLLSPILPFPFASRHLLQVALGSVLAVRTQLQARQRAGPVVLVLFESQEYRQHSPGY